MSDDNTENKVVELKVISRHLGQGKYVVEVKRGDDIELSLKVAKFATPADKLTKVKARKGFSVEHNGETKEFFRMIDLKTWAQGQVDGLDEKELA